MEEMGRGRIVGPDQERLTFDDLADIITNEYEAKERKSANRLKVSLKVLRSFFGTGRALDITTDRVDAYIACRRKAGRANSTIRNEVNALRRAMVLAKRAGKLAEVPPFDAPPVTVVRRGFFSRDDLNDVLHHLPHNLRPVVRFAYLTGWRTREILTLTWAQVDMDAGIIRLEPGTTKNNEGREIPFRALPELDALIREQHKWTKQVQRTIGAIVPTVFHREGQPIKYFRGTWDTACVKAGNPGAWFHDLRRSAVRNMERAGVSRSVAMEVTGHKTESIYKRYAIADVVSLEEGLKKLAGLDASRGTAVKLGPPG